MNPSGHTIRSLIDINAANNPEKTFVVYPDTAISHTWFEFQERAKAINIYLQNMSVSFQRPVTGLLGNGQAALELFLGAMYGGFQVLLANPLSGTDILAYVLEHSETMHLFVDQNHNELALSAISKMTKKPKLIKFDPSQIKDLTNEGLAGKSNNMTTPQSKDDALLIYTSGTTGKPKGVLHTHESLIYGGWNTMIAHDLTLKDRGLCVLPLCHINAQVVSVMGTLVSSSELVLPEKFKASKFWYWITKEKCSWFSVVPTILSYLLNAEEDCQLKSKLKKIRFGRSASSALPPALHKAFEERFGINIVETMGITETAAQMLSNPLDKKLHKLGSPGKAFGNQVRVANAEGILSHAGDESEIQIYGKNVMRGYLKNLEATKEAFTPDGWYRSGDLGKMDKEGFFFVTGRLKEIIIKGGENISPREIDDVLYRHKAVLEAAAFPVTDESYGQTIAAAIVIRPGEHVTESELRTKCEIALGEYRTPKYFLFLKELPKGPSGKIQRLKLTEQFD